jgi:hypothetical protein
MGRIASWLTQIVKGRYTCYLEQELERTRTELRQWQGIFLTHEGLPKLDPSVPRPLPKMSNRMLPSQLRQKLEAFTLPKEKPSGSA